MLRRPKNDRRVGCFPLVDRGVRHVRGGWIIERLNGLVTQIEMQIKNLVLLISLGLMMAGCAKPPTRVEVGDREKILYVGNGAEPRDLDPQVITALTDSWICQTLFENLVVPDPDTGKPKPAAALSWDVSDDGLTYTFHLRPGAQWSNGDSVTAQDFLWSYQRMLTPAFAAEYSYMLWVVENAEKYNKGELKDFSKVGFSAPDPMTLRVNLARPTPYFLALVAHQSWSPVHPSTILKYGKMDQRGTDWTRPGNLVGNGPFSLTEWKPNDVVSVKRNTNYWDAANVKLNEIRFYPIENAATEERAFRGGQLHITYGLPVEKTAIYRKEHSDVLRVESWPESDYIRVNVTRKPLDDVRVRRALGMALDRKGITEDVRKRGEQPAHHYTPDMPGYTATADLPTDFDKARKLLAEAGYPDGRGFPKIELLFPTSKGGQEIVEAIQATWKKELNIDVTVRNEEFKVYLDTQRKLQYDLSLSIWLGDYPDPNTFLDMMLTGNGNNDTGWGDPDYDRLITQANLTNDREKRFGIFQKAEDILMQQAPVLPIFFGAHVYLVRPEVKSYQVAPGGIVAYKDVDLVPK